MLHTCVCMQWVYNTFHTIMSTYSSGMADIRTTIFTVVYLWLHVYWLYNFTFAMYIYYIICDYIYSSYCGTPSLYHSHAQYREDRWNIAIYFVVLVHALCQPVMHVILCLWNSLAIASSYKSSHSYSSLISGRAVLKNYVCEQ